MDGGLKVAIVLPTVVKEKEEEIAEASYINLARATQKAGVDVTFFTLTRNKQPRVSYLNGVKIVFCPYSISLSKLPKFLSAAGFTWLTDLKGAHFRYKSALSLFNTIRKYRPELIHLRGFFLTNLLMLPLFRACSIPTIIEPVEYPFYRGIRKSLTKTCLKWATKIFVLEKDVADRLVRECGIPKEKIVRIECTGFDERLFFPGDKESSRNKLGLDSGSSYLLYVGSIYPKGFVKDPFELLHVLKELKKTGEKYKLIVVGPGNVEEYLNFAKELGVHEDVIMAGYMKPSNLNVYYNAADVFLWPYPQDTLGVGTALTEAMACGLPVVSYLGKHVPEGESCIKYVPFRDRKAMAEKVLELLKNDEMRSRLVKNCLQMIREFSFSKVGEKTKLEYEKILGRPP